MPDRIGIWAMAQKEDGSESAEPLTELQNTETEQRLEELLVASPDVLIKGLRLIGRQLQTAGGPLDLIGVDPDGQIVLFELKRGTMTRTAVAQILDYASDLLERDASEFANLIQAGSGHHGIDRIDDFSEWYAAEFPDVSEPDLDNIRMVLVGLGVDERAKRIVNMLARTGLDIQLMTFQAFRRGEEVLLARRVETVDPASSSGDAAEGTKAGNRRLLEQLANEQEVLDLLLEVADFVAERMPDAYRWPNKTAFTYSLNDITDEGRPTQRTYAAVWVNRDTKGELIFSLPDRALEIAEDAANQAVDDIAEARLTSNSWTPFALPIKRSTWRDIRPKLERLIDEVTEAHKAHMDEVQIEN